MKTDRLIGIITILQQQGRTTAPELAERFGVSRRTINRDIEDICKVGIPIVTAQGYGGGIFIDAGYKMEKSVLSQEEIQELLAGLGDIDHAAKETYFTKILEKFSSKESRIIVDDVIMIDLVSNSPFSLTRKIEVIRKTIVENHLISFRYYHEKGDCHRTIEPYRLVLKGTLWFVYGYCRNEGKFELFQLNRMTRLKDMSEIFLVRDVPDFEMELEDHSGKGIHLKAVFAAWEKYRLVEAYGEDACSETEEGRVLLECDFTSYPHMLEWVMSFGGQVEVLEPAVLRQDLRRQAQMMLDLYRTSG